MDLVTIVFWVDLRSIHDCTVKLFLLKTCFFGNENNFDNEIVRKVVMINVTACAFLLDKKYDYEYNENKRICICKLQMYTKNTSICIVKVTK